MANILKAFCARHPMAVNSLLYGAVYVGAEISQQILTKKYMVQPPEPIDKSALARVAVMGSFVYAPMLYKWYKFANHLLPGTATTILVKKLVLEQFIMTPVLMATFFTGLSLMERANDPLEELREKFLTTFGKSFMCWLPVHTINLLFVPVQWRVLFMGAYVCCRVNVLCWAKRTSLQPSEVGDAVKGDESCELESRRQQLAVIQ